METVITFDQGAKWQTLRRPQNSLCDTETSTNRPKRVRYIHRFMYSMFKYILFYCHVHVFFFIFFHLTLRSMSFCSEHMTYTNISLIIVSLQCRLHIHASYSTTMKMNIPMLPLSQPNAVGLILAHGTKNKTQKSLCFI